MRIVFIGATIFGYKCLQAAERIDNCEIVGVLTAPQFFCHPSCEEKIENVQYADISSFCKPLNIPCYVMEKGMKDMMLLDQISSLKPDVFLVSGWYHIIPLLWRKVAPAYGLHASLLPDYSGWSPLVWAMINGEKKTGITFFRLASGVDNGPIIGQKETPIYDHDTIATLYKRIEELGVQLVTENLPKLSEGNATETVQDEKIRRVFPQRLPKDGQIDWTKTNTEIYNFVRAQTKPYPGAFTIYEGKKLTIWESNKVSEDPKINCTLGEVVTSTNRFLVQTGSGLLEIGACSYGGKEF